MLFNVEQRSEEWHKLRLGKFTGSRFADVLSKETTATYNNLINTIVYEILSGQREETYESEWMRRGTELEPEARQEYEFLTNNKVQEIGFIQLDEFIGISPDGLISEDGVLEIKCPKHTTHIDYLLKNELPSTYKPQVQGQLMVSKRQWCDFVSYHPDLDTLIVRVERDEEYITELRQKLDKAIQEVQTRITKLKERK